MQHRRPLALQASLLAWLPPSFFLSAAQNERPPNHKPYNFSLDLTDIIALSLWHMGHHAPPLAATGGKPSVLSAF
jgi:hypothetical protein